MPLDWVHEIWRDFKTKIPGQVRTDQPSVCPPSTRTPGQAPIREGTGGESEYQDCRQARGQLGADRQLEDEGGTCHISRVRTEAGRLPDGHHCEVDVTQPHLQ